MARRETGAGKVADKIKIASVRLAKSVTTTFLSPKLKEWCRKTTRRLVKAFLRAAEVVDVERGPNREKRAGYLTFQVGG